MARTLNTLKPFGNRSVPEQSANSLCYSRMMDFSKSRLLDLCEVSFMTMHNLYNMNDERFGGFLIYTGAKILICMMKGDVFYSFASIINIYWKMTWNMPTQVLQATNCFIMFLCHVHLDIFVSVNESWHGIIKCFRSIHNSLHFLNAVSDYM